MKKQTITLLTLLFLLLNITLTHAKQIDNIIVRYKYIPPQHTQTIAQSLYSNIQFVDNRDPDELYTIELSEQQVEDGLNQLIQKLTDQTAQQKNLILQLRRLTIGKGQQNKNQINIRLALYTQLPDQTIHTINTLDKKIEIKNLKNIKNQISHQITHFISDNLHQQPRKTLGSPNNTTPLQIENIENIEKENIKFFQNNDLTDGIYITPEKFFNQTPLDGEITPKFKKNELKEIKMTDPKNSRKTIKIHPENIYAVIIEGQPYIAYNKKYIPIYEGHNNLYFQDIIKTSQINLAPIFGIEISSGGYRGGGFGLNIFTSPHKEKIHFKIDHLNGEIIPLTPIN